MKKVLLATDLGLNTDRAMERAVRLANLHGAQLHILHVVPTYLLPGKKAQAFSFRQDAEKLIKAYLSGCKGIKNLKTVIAVIESDNASAASEIIRYADKIKADIIVMGIHGKERFRDLFIGTTIERVVRTETRPVLMVKNKPVGDYKNILSGTDFSKSSKKALNIATQLSPGATVRLIHTYDFPDTSIGEKVKQYSGDFIKKIESDKLKKFVKENAKILKKYGVKEKKFSFSTKEGAVYDSFVRESKARKSDLLAIGTHGNASILPFRLGGVAEDILANPPCDILVTRG